jgi:hypothetical protein
MPGVDLRSVSHASDREHMGISAQPLTQVSGRRATRPYILILDGIVQRGGAHGGRTLPWSVRMPFLVLDSSSYPMVDPVTGLICQFPTRQEAEDYRKSNKGSRIMQIPEEPSLTQQSL